MMESIFGLAQPVWTGVPPSGFGWLPTSMPIATRGSGPALGSPVPTSQIPILPNSIGDLTSAVQASTAVPGLFSPLVAAEFGAGVPAPVLLATVATRRGQPHGPMTDAEIEEFLYDAFELLPGTSDVEVHSEGGRATLTGTVTQKRLKRDIGEIAWAIGRVTDVQNNLTVASRRRSRTSGRDIESAQGSVRKHA
jgi:hypothetical protein